MTEETNTENKVIKQEKRRVVISLILFGVVAVALGVTVGYFAYEMIHGDEGEIITKWQAKKDREEKEKKEQEEKKDSPKNLKEKLDAMKVSYIDMIATDAEGLLWKSDDAKKSFTYQEYTIDVALSKSEHDGEVKLTMNGQEVLTAPYEGTEISAKAYLFQNYLIVVTKEEAGSGLYILDPSLAVINEVYADKDALPVFSDKNIYYGVAECSGTRSDNTLGKVLEVHKFSTETVVDTIEYNIDYTGDWACEEKSN